MLRMLNGAHPNIMRLDDVSEIDGRLCMVMPKLSGSLAQAIESKSLSSKQKLHISTLLLHALSFLHENGVMHRDSKRQESIPTQLSHVTHITHTHSTHSTDAPHTFHTRSTHVPHTLSTRSTQRFSEIPAPPSHRSQARQHPPRCAQPANTRRFLSRQVCP